MARQESDREDLFAEARSLKRRLEADLSGRTIVVGFRSNNFFSFFYGQDTVCHFNRAGELRRAYLKGDLLRAEPGRKLTRLRRQREFGQTVLSAHECTREETATVLDALRSAASSIFAAMRDERTRWLRCEPQGERDRIAAEATELLQRFDSSGFVVADGMQGQG